MDKKFSKWCEKLLDTGKGNRLINFKDVMFRTIDILSPSSSDLLKKISNGEKLSFYDVDSYVKIIKEQLKSENVDDEKIIKDKLTKNSIKDTLSKFLTAKQILGFKQDVSLNKILTNVKKIAQEYIDEKGINILYIAFGMLCWKDDKNTAETFNSPLVLIPISIDLSPQDKVYSIKEYNDDIITNPTLLYKLKNEYNISLPEFRESGYEDEKLADYFVRINDFVGGRSWYVKDEIKIGTFSFLKLDMYKDLKENQEKILENANIQKLLNNNISISEDMDTETARDTSIENELEVYDNMEHLLNNVVDADSSQMMAIMQAKRGESFVLQGPPGTGKSQTITNIIAELLSDGKKVLFVSEKLAALNVVFNNLKKVGLSDYCLELHSNKSNKKEVISELYRVLTLNKKSVDLSAIHEIEELEKNEKFLDNYSNFIHKKLDGIDKTPYEIFNIISENYNVSTFEYVLKDIGSRDASYFNSAVEILKQFISYSDYIGYDYTKNVWAGLKHFDFTYQNKIEFKNLINEVLDYFNSFNNLISIIEQGLHLKIESAEKFDYYYEFLKLLSNLEFFDNNIFNKDILINIISKIKIYLETKEKLEQCKSKVFSKYKQEIFNIDISMYYNLYNDKYNKFSRILNSKYRKDKKFLQSYQININEKIHYDEVLDYLLSAKNAIDYSLTLKNNEKDIISLLKSPYETKKYNWEKIYSELVELKDKLTFKFNAFDDINLDEFIKIKHQISDLVCFYDGNKKIRHNVEILQGYFDTAAVNYYKLPIKSVIEKLQNCISNYDKIENYNRFSEILEKLSNLNLKEFVDKSIDEKIDRKTLHLTFTTMFYMQYIYSVISENEILGTFSRVNQDLTVKNFIEKDKLKFEISKARIIANVSKNIPDERSIASGSQVSTLVREMNKKIKQKPVRVLFNEIGELVLRLKPCLLMSPLSVSSYLNFNSLHFDTVIFDEASQIFPWDSIGAISRASQVIVVGDSKQMPPSNFFNAGFTENDEQDDEYEDDTLDFESILDLSSAVFNQHRLNWHYRSKTEDLIAFSNANFYDNTLVTFPSAYKNRKDMGVNFYYVDNGIFDRKSKSNRNEAERVVDLVFEHFRNNPSRSLGVVAFSISQQEVIEEIIQKRREKCPEFEKFFDSGLAEPFFIKNLETVQGDERDTIIFSVAYAKDMEGKFLHNFGPLNKKGGERRLNVAVTRAKYNIKLVASIKSSDIDLSKSSMTGTRLLKEYLYFAELGAGSENRLVQDVNEKLSIEEEICQFLISRGFKAEKNIGFGEYRIGVAVKYPSNSDYILAIETDGKNYYMAKTTRDRDRLRKEILERLGWKFYRIWSIDWFLNKEIEKENLVKIVEKAIKEYDDNLREDSKLVSGDLGNNMGHAFLVESPARTGNLKSLFTEYEEYDLYSKKHPTFDNSIYEIVSKEAPITEELLLKKTVGLFGREKVTSTIRQKFSREMAKYADKIFKIDDYYVVDKNMIVKMRVPKDDSQPRDIMNIANIEISSGMFVIIQNSVGITEIGLFNTTANLLGYSRIGTNISQKFRESLDILLKGNLIKYEDGEYFVNK